MGSYLLETTPMSIQKSTSFMQEHNPHNPRTSCKFFYVIAIKICTGLLDLFDESVV
ncbi:hypothetical protein WN48_01091 [Eufriesea mexicana]|nr:hypothetical protein WN48_01091 [Eufriesea mexicana]